MSIRYAICLIAVLACGCTTYTSSPLSRNQSNGLSKDACAAVKGVPIAVKVPTHLDVYIDETFYLMKNTVGKYQEVSVVGETGSIRNLGIRPEMITTKKIFVVDFKRAASGVTSSGLEFNDNQYLKKVTGRIQDDTLKDATAAFSALAPLLSAKPTAAAGETKKLNDAVRGSRVVAYRRFDLNDCDFEQQVCDFVEYHMNACHDCKGPKNPDFLQYQYSDAETPQNISVASDANDPATPQRR